MDKDKIMNYWDQLAHLTFLCHADNIMHGNETGPLVGPADSSHPVRDGK